MDHPSFATIGYLATGNTAEFPSRVRPRRLSTTLLTECWILFLFPFQFFTIDRLVDLWILLPQFALPFL